MHHVSHDHVIVAGAKNHLQNQQFGKALEAVLELELVFVMASACMGKR